jgi:hypothetical protein
MKSVNQRIRLGAFRSGAPCQFCMDADGIDLYRVTRPFRSRAGRIHALQ